MPIASFFRSAAGSLRALFAASLTFAAALAQSPSAVDGFDPNVDGNVYALAAQPDGRLILGGQFATLRPGIGAAAGRANLARVNPDGSLDLAFDPGADAPIRTVVLQRDGRILVGGDFTTIAGVARPRLARLNADGSLDTTFNAGAINGAVNALVVLPDGRLVIGGAFTSVAGSARGRCARLGATGALDAAFNPNFNNLVFALALHADGKVIVGGAFTSLQPAGHAAATGRGRLARLHADGTPDSEFDGGANHNVYAIAVQRDGKIVFGGAFSTVKPIPHENPQNRSRLARLQPNGEFDGAFFAGAAADVNALVVQPDGSLLAGGAFTSAFGGGVTLAGRSFLARFTPEGALDANFAPGVNQVVSALALLPDGKFAAAGYFTRATSRGAPTGAVRNRVARFHADGALDATFAPDEAGRPLLSVVQPDGRIMIAGTFTSVGGVTRNHLARLNADGTLDPAFNPNPNGLVRAVAVQADGRIVLGGQFTTLGGVPRNRLARLNANGSLDTAFDPNPDSTVEALAVQSDGKILVGGMFISFTPTGTTTATSRFNLARLNTDGTVDTAFNAGLNNSVLAFAIQSDGKILAGGTFTSFTPPTGNPVSRANLLRLNPDGTLDSAYNPSPNGAVLTLALAPDGKLIAGGTFTNFPIPNVAANATVTTHPRNRLARINADGTIDAFDPNANGTVNTVAVQADGRVLVGGGFTTFTPNGADPGRWVQRLYAGRLNADGTVDATFDPGINERPGNNVTSFRVQADGRILLCGGFASLQPLGAPTRLARNRLVRLNANGSLDAAFNPAAGGPSTGTIHAIATQADGRIVLAGQFSDLGGTGTANIARFHPEGTIDTSFSRATGTDGAINAVALRPDVTGLVPQLPGFAWLNATGTALAPAFRVPANLTVGGTISAFAFEADGALLLAGSFANLAGASGGNLVRVRADGSLDTGFNPNPNGTVSLLAVQADGRILIAGTFTSLAPNGGAPVTRNRLARLERDGSVTPFDPNPKSNVRVLRQLPSGQVLIAGEFTTVTPNLVTTTTITDAPAAAADRNSTTTTNNPDGSTTTTTITVAGTTRTTAVTTSRGGVVTNRNFVALLSAEGDAVAAFNPNPDNLVTAGVVQADGKIVLGGLFTSFTPNPPATAPATPPPATTRRFLARVNTDGTLDAAYDPNPNANVHALALQPDGRVLVGGEFTRLGTTARFNLARVNADGGVDAAFDPNANAAVTLIALAPDGSMLVSGLFTALQPAGTASAPRAGFARLTAAGALDLAFDPVPNGAVSAATIRADGGVLLAGTFTEFNPGGVMFVGGTFTTIGGLPARGLAALNHDGSASSSFTPNPNGAVNALLIQPDGRLVVGGAFTQIAGVARNGLARFNTSGTLDAAFNPAADGTVTALALQSDGRLVVGGVSGSGAGSLVRRINVDGTVDATFAGPAAGAGAVETVSDLVLQPDGRILVAAFVRITGNANPRISRLNANGTADATFSAALPPATGVAATRVTVALQSDGRIVAGGAFSTGGGTLAGLARIGSNGALEGGFAPALDGGVTAIGLQSDGRVLLGGAFKNIGGTTRPGLARLAATSTAVQSLSIAGGTGASRNLIWMRDGTSMELSSVRFEVSRDTRNWTVLVANAQRATGARGWQSGNVTVPTDALFYVRARGLVASGTGTSGIVEYVQQFNLSDSARFAGPQSSQSFGSVIDSTGRVVAVQTSSAGTGEFFPSLAASAAITQPGSGNAVAPGFGVIPVNPGPIGPGGPPSSSTEGLPAANAAARLANLSVRARVTSDTPLITGFAISGSGTRAVLLRGVGPSLGEFGVTAPLAAPRLQVFDATGRLVVENSGWAATPANATEVGAALARTGAFPFAANSGADAAVVLTLAPGAYSMQVQDRGATGGVALAEIYDADSSPASRLVNLSARSSVTSAETVIITGFVVTGGTKNLLVRGLGPALMPFGVANVLPDPAVSIYDVQGRLLAANDNWTAGTDTGLAATSARVSAFPLGNGSSDAALGIALAPGVYTVQLSASPTSGRGGPADTAPAAIGAAMLEVYELP